MAWGTVKLRRTESALEDWEILAHSALPYAQLSAHKEDHNPSNGLIADGRAMRSLANEFADHPAFTKAVMQPQRDREERPTGRLLLLQIGDERWLCRVDHLGLVFDSTGFDVPLRLLDVYLNPDGHLLASI